MQYTNHYNLNLPEGSDIVNPLVQDNPNYSAIDTALYDIKVRIVGGATEVKSGTVHAITRSDADIDVMRFTATGNWETGDTMTVDGTPVSVYLPDGAAPLTGAYIINTEVVAILNGSRVTLLCSNPAALPPTPDAGDISYVNSGSGLTATNVQDAIDELSNSGVAPVDVTSLITQVVAHDSFKATKYGNMLMLTGAVAASIPNATKILTLPASIVVDEAASTNYVGGLGASSASQSIPTALRINTSGDVFLVNALALATTSNSYHVIIPIV